jgi:hypothetical protein
LLAGDLVVVLAARYAGLLNTWDGEPDPKFEKKLRVLRGLAQDMALVRRTLHRATKQKNEFEQKLEDEQKQSMEEMKKELLAPIWAKFESKPLAELFGGGDRGRKLAEFVTAVQNDLPPPKIAKTEQSGQTWSNPVKP